MRREVQAIRDIQHFGEEGGVVPVIDPAVTSTFLNPKDMERVFHGELSGCYLYSRHSNPSVSQLSQKLAAMEGMEAAVGVASGMGAITSVVNQLLINGGHLISSNTIYGGTYAYFANILTKRGVKVTFVDPHDTQQFEKAITPETKLIYTETLSNPLLALSDLSALSAICKKNRIKLVVDNTFTPLVISPAKLGADVVIHSCTKYISGAADMIAGAIISDQAFINELIDVNTGFVMLHGPTMDSRIAYELYTRLDHLHIRMEAHGRYAMNLAKKIEGAGISVLYPGLPSHPQHELFKKEMNEGHGFSGMMTIELPTLEDATRLASYLQNAKFGLFAVSLGFARTLMSCPSASTSSEIPLDMQKKMGLKQGLLRLSIGYTGDEEEMSRRFFECYKKLGLK